MQDNLLKLRFNRNLSKSELEESFKWIERQDGGTEICGSGAIWRQMRREFGPTRDK